MTNPSTPGSNPPMSRRRFLETGAVAIVAGAGASQLLGAATRPRRPNILFLMDDQHRGDTLGVAGHPCVQTPNIDRLAREGAYFPQAYASVPSCLAARASILTGRSPWGHGMLGYTHQAKRWPFEGPTALRDAGYHTVVVGKNHFNPWRNPHGYEAEQLYDGLPECDRRDDYGLWLAKVAPGVDEHATGLGWNDRGGKPWPHADHLHPTEWTGRQAVDFLSGYRDEKPFFLKVSFHRPHSPFDPVAKWFDHYGKVELPRPAVGDWAERWFGGYTPPCAPSAARANLPWEDVRNGRQGYYGAISHVDEQVGRVLAALEKRGDLERTLIVFASDHGEMVGDHHLWRKTHAMEGSVRVPMIVRWGDELMTAKRGQVLPQLAELRDLVPTFLDAAGVGCPKELEGRSLLDPVRGTAGGWRTQVDLEHSTCYFEDDAWTALTDGRVKYVYFAYDGRQLLFDLAADPTELHDLAADPAHAETLKAWRQRMVEHLSVRGPLWARDGELQLRTRPMPYGANFPREA